MVVHKENASIPIKCILQIPPDKTREPVALPSFLYDSKRVLLAKSIICNEKYAAKIAVAIERTTKLGLYTPLMIKLGF